ncbi:MAG TPA: DNA translocase FtsK, partial [Anseongella sp.]|nr:DNA translocase FtsK [Anseongella sp.]
RLSLVYTLVALLYVPLVIAFVNSFINNTIHYAEGVYGYQTNIWLNITIGKAGTAFLLLFIALAGVVFTFNPSFDFLRRKEKPAGDPEGSARDGGNGRNTRLEEELEEEIVFDPIELIPKRMEDGTETRTINELFAEKFRRRGGGEGSDAGESDTVENDEGTFASPPKERPAAEKLKSNEPSFSIERTEEEKLANSLVQEHGLYDPTLDLQDYRFPHLDLLANHGSSRPSVSAEELEANKNKIVGTLANYGIDIDKIKATIGPTVTLYEIIPSPGVRISKIRNLEDDIALSLAALGIRIIAPIPGKGTIGIEVPNQHPEIVSMRSVMATEKYQNANMEL